MGIGTFGLIATRHCGDLDARRRRKTGEGGRKARQLAETTRYVLLGWGLLCRIVRRRLVGCCRGKEKDGEDGRDAVSCLGQQLEPDHGQSPEINPPCPPATAPVSLPHHRPILWEPAVDRCWQEPPYDHERTLHSVAPRLTGIDERACEGLSR